jgi:hypothetical protein
MSCLLGQGGEATLQELARGAGPALLTTLPRLWDQIATPLASLATAQQQAQQQQQGTAGDASQASCTPLPQQQQQQQQQQGAAPAVSIVDAAQLQPSVNALHVLKVVGPEMHPDLLPHLLALLPLVGLCSQHPNAALKLAAACCFAALAAAHTQPVMPYLLRLLTPLMAGARAATATAACCWSGGVGASACRHGMASSGGLAPGWSIACGM